MTKKLVGLVLLFGSGCLSTPSGPPIEDDPPDAAAPRPPDAAATPDATTVQASCVNTSFEAGDRWYGCSTLGMFTACAMDTLYNQQVDGGERCYDCHTAAGADGHPSGGLLLSQDPEATWQAFRVPPGMYLLAVPVSGPSGYAGLEMNDIMIRKGIIDNDGHPNYEFDTDRLAALDCFMGQMMALYTDCGNACTNP